MEPDGDIFDEFSDSDELARSIEAGRQGPWNDDSAGFKDPKLAALQRQITQPQKLDYRERRKREFEEKGLEKRGKKKRKQKASPDAERKKSNVTGPVVDHDWDEETLEPTIGKVKTGGKSGTARSSSSTRRSTAKAPPVGGSIAPAPSASQWDDTPLGSNAPADNPLRQRVAHAHGAAGSSVASEAVKSQRKPRRERRKAPSALAGYVPSFLSSTLVYATVAAMHSMIVGWSDQLPWRSLGALITCGVLWRLLRAGRTRAMAVSAIAYCGAFLPKTNLEEPQYVFGMFLGLMVAIAGAGMIGAQREDISDPKS